MIALFNWVSGLLSLAIGGLVFGKAPLVGATFIIISVILLPPVRRVVYSKTNIKIPASIRVVSVLALFMLTEVLLGMRVEEDRKKRASYFSQHKDEIIMSLNDMVSGGKYSEALDVLDKYSGANINRLKIDFTLPHTTWWAP